MASAAKNRTSGRREHWAAGTESAELRSAARDVEEMGDAGPVESTITGLWRVQIHVEVNVDKPHRRMVALCAGDGPEFNRAVAAK